MKLSLHIVSISAMCMILLYSFLSPVSLHAELKVVESSNAKLPEWMMHHPQDHLVCMSEGSTLAEAQRRLEQEILRQVAGAVAVYVQSETVVDMGKEEDKEWDNFRNTITTAIANLPFISDITLAKCKDTYWDHAIDKATGVDTYRMTALYPFDSHTRQALINQYEAYDAQLEDNLDRLERCWEEINSSVDVAKAESELEVLSQSFPDANRRKRCRLALDLYRDISKNLSLEAEIISDHVCIVRVLRGSALFHVEGRLDVSSECATDIKVKRVPEGWTIRFNTDDCLKDDLNSLSITLRSSGIRLKTSIGI